MPWLTPAELEDLVRAAARRPGRIHLAHDGTRCQPLLGVYPSDERHRRSLAAALAGGELRLQGWLAGIDTTAVVLPAARLRNANRPADCRLASGGPAAPG
jgi:molybdopterin-guanine dinucleotide biosynthesis protein A